MKKLILLSFVLLISTSLSSQSISQKDKSIYKEYNPGYYQNTILKGIEEYNATKATSVKSKKTF